MNLSLLNILIASCLSIFCIFGVAAQPVKTIQIPFTLTDQGHMLVKAKINGVAGNFIFDTGAGINMLTKKFADSVKSLKKTDGFYVGHRATGEAIETDLWTMDSLELGGTSFSGGKLSVIDIDFPLAGLISLTPFKDRPLTIDFNKKCLTIETASGLAERKAAGNVVPIQVDDERGITLGISTYVRVNDRLLLQVILDSGAGFNVFRFNSRYTGSLGLDTAKMAHRYTPSDFDPAKGNHSYSATVTGLATENGLAGVKDVTASFVQGLIYEGITCINWLGKVITIDLPHQELIVSQ